MHGITNQAFTEYTGVQVNQLRQCNFKLTHQDLHEVEKSECFSFEIIMVRWTVVRFSIGGQVMSLIRQPLPIVLCVELQYTPVVLVGLRQYAECKIGYRHFTGY